MDVYGWYIVMIRQFLGHDKAAAAMQVPAGDKTECLICAYEQYPTPETRQIVEQALARAAEESDE